MIGLSDNEVARKSPLGEPLPFVFVRAAENRRPISLVFWWAKFNNVTATEQTALRGGVVVFVSTGSVEAPDSADEVDSVASRAQVARILESRHFAKAERLKRFLRFVTEETLNGLSIEIKESVVGVEVFDRDAATYDPRTDPIVRVQATRVRARLADYYANEGANDRVLVELPRGQYVPHFSLRSTAKTGALRAPAIGMQPPTRSVVALNQYLLGRFHWNKRDEAGLRAGLAHFHKAIQIDPHHGRALAGIADCNIMLAMSGAEAPAACVPLAERAALRALEIDNRLVEAHTSLGVVRAGFHWDWQGSETEFQRGLESDQSYATLHHWYSIYLLAPLSRFDQAKMEIELAEQLDPASLTINLGRAQTLYLAGECLSAIAQCMKVLRLDERYYRAYWWLGLAQSRLGNFEAATEALETARARAGADMSFRARILGALGHTYGRSGRADRASAVLDELAAMSQSNYVDPFEIAHVLAGLGRSDHALDSLERAADDRSGWLSYCGVWSAFESLRPNPRFQAILKGMKLRRSGNGST